MTRRSLGWLTDTQRARRQQWLRSIIPVVVPESCHGNLVSCVFPSVQRPSSISLPSLVEPMPTVTLLIDRLKAGSRSALAAIGGRFQSYRLIQAKCQLGPGYAGLHQPEDVANLVLHRLWREVQAGRKLGVELSDTASLIAALGLLTRQQVQKVREYEGRASRAAARTVALSTDSPAATEPASTLELPDGLSPRQRHVAELLAAGWIQEELPAVFGCSLSTIYRDVKVIGSRLRVSTVT